MGYWVYQREVRFFLARRYHQVALAATRSLTGRYSWVNTTQVLSAETLPEVFEAWRWGPPRCQPRPRRPFPAADRS